MVEGPPPVVVHPPLRIGTRRSNLAVVQAEGIRDSLQRIAPDRSFEIEALRTLGDKDQSTALYSFGAKNLWTTELEEKLTSGQLDVIVHCLKGEFDTDTTHPLPGGQPPPFFDVSSPDHPPRHAYQTP